MKFTKMQGNGNDFVVLEDLESNIENLGELSKKLCDRHFGVGADGILVVRNTEEADIEMIIINSDGSYASMCGNGIRCFAKYIYEMGIVKKEEISIKTGDGIKIAYLKIHNGLVETVTINMGHPSFETKDIPAAHRESIINKAFTINNKDYILTSLLMGVPHTVLFGELQSFNVEEGRYIEKYEIFTKGTNVNFCEVISPSEVSVMTWERGAGPTLACGTGSCASVVAGNKLGLVGKKVKVNLPGGVLYITLGEEGVLMEGPAQISFYGEI